MKVKTAKIKKRYVASSTKRRSIYVTMKKKKKIRKGRPESDVNVNNYHVRTEKKSVQHLMAGKLKQKGQLKRNYASVKTNGISGM